MRANRIGWIGIIGVVAALASASSAARADVPKGVQKALRGQILFTEQELPDVSGDSDAAATRKLRALAQKSLKHTAVDGVATWSFNYTAFLKSPPKVSELSFDFYTDDKARLFVADKRFTGVDPNLKILSGRMSINEDENVNKGRKYIVKLTGKVHGKERVFATTKITFE